MKTNSIKRSLLGVLLTLTQLGFGQTISPYLIGNNYWYPGGNAATLMAPGKEMQTASFKFIRIGGFGANTYSNANLITYIDAIRAMGAEPQLQVPYNKTDQQVKDLITYINITMKRNIKYWSVGNEPDHDGGGHQSVITVEQYTKRISSALKSIDPTIKVIAFELAGYNQNYDTDYNLQKDYYLADGVTKNPNYIGYGYHFWNRLLGGANDCTGKDANGNYYIDIVSWHYYGWNDQTQTVLDRMDDMVGRLKTINANRATAPIQWMMGEINTHWDNTKATADGKVWSFRAGQAYAEVYGAAMQRNAHTIAFWSIYEGKDDQYGVADRGFNDLSLFDKDNTPRSNYWHSLMLGQNMRANYATSADNYTSIKTVAMKDDTGVSVMVMNSNTSASFPYSLKLDLTGFTAAQALQITVDAGINFQYEDAIPARTTQMLIFNKYGQLTKKYTYSEQDAIALKAPTVVSTPITITHTVPGKIEAEDYSAQFGLQVETLATTEGPGQDLGYTTAGDFAEYLIDVTKAGNYLIDFRVASLNGNAGLSLLLDGNVLITELPIASTTGWQVWKTISDTIALTAGKHTLRFNVTKAGFNINWMEIKVMPEAPVITFTNLTNNQNIIQGTDLNINLDATHSSGIANIQLYLDDVLVRQENIAPYDWGLGTNDPQLNTIPSGKHIFKAVANATNGEFSEKSITIIISTVTSFFENTRSNFSFYPNPVENNLQLSESKNWEVYSINGQSITKGKGDIIPMNNLENGLYLIHIEGNMYKIIKK